MKSTLSPSLQSIMPLTDRIFTINRYLVCILSVAMATVGISAAILRGINPVSGSIVAALIAILFFWLITFLRKRTCRQLEQREFSAWMELIVAASLFTLLVFGIFWLKELFRPEVRSQFRRIVD